LSLLTLAAVCLAAPALAQRKAKAVIFQARGLGRV